MTTFDPLNFDPDGPLRHIRHLDADQHTDLGYYATALVHAYAELAAQHEAQLKTLAILRGETRPRSCNTDGVDTTHTLAGLEADATPYDPAGVHELNQALANELDAKDIEIRELKAGRDAFVAVVALIHDHHRMVPADDPDIGLVCVPRCGACQVIAAVPNDILDAYDARADAYTPTTANQGDPQ